MYPTSTSPTLAIILDNEMILRRKVTASGSWGIALWSAILALDCLSLYFLIEGGVNIFLKALLFEGFLIPKAESNPLIQ